LSGAHPTLGDFSVAGMTTYFKAAGFPFHEYPGISRWYARMDELDSWRSTEVAFWTEHSAAG
jgi:glutathione S-transferase